MKKILAFAGSNSKNSINKKLLNYVVGRIENHEVKVLELNDYEFPMFGVDHENEKGYPADVRRPGRGSTYTNPLNYISYTL